MSAESRRVHLRFSMQNPKQKAAYEAIMAIPVGQRMEYLCGIISGEARALNIEQRVLTAVRQFLQECQPPNNQDSRGYLPKKEDVQAEIPQQMMDFLGTL